MDKEKVAKLASRWAAGESFVEIARDVGYTPVHVGREISKYCDEKYIQGRR